MPTLTQNLATPTVIAKGLVNGTGCAYWQKTDQVLVTNAGDGTIAAVTVHGSTHVPKVVGKGYDGPQDIALSRSRAIRRWTPAPS